MRIIGGGVESYPFSWAYVKDKGKFIDCLKNMDMILAGDIWFEPWAVMYLCRNSMISFHPRMGKNELLYPDGGENMENRAAAIAELKSRMNHLVDKMANLFAGTENTLFLAKVKGEGKNADCAYALKLNETLKELYKSGCYKLVLVFEQEYSCKELDACEDKHLAIRYVKRFADDAKTNTDSDWDGWLHIFQEFDMRDEKEYYEKIKKKTGTY